MVLPHSPMDTFLVQARLYHRKMRLYMCHNLSEKRCGQTVGAWLSFLATLKCQVFLTFLGLWHLLECHLTLTYLFSGEVTPSGNYHIFCDLFCRNVRKLIDISRSLQWPAIGKMIMCIRFNDSIISPQLDHCPHLRCQPKFLYTQTYGKCLKSMYIHQFHNDCGAHPWLMLTR